MKQIKYVIVKKEGRKEVYGAGWYPTYGEALRNVPGGLGRVFKIKRVFE